MGRARANLGGGPENCANHERVNRVSRNFSALIVRRLGIARVNTSLIEIIVE